MTPATGVGTMQFQRQSSATAMAVSMMSMAARIKAARHHLPATCGSAAGNEKTALMPVVLLYQPRTHVRIA